ncbi:MAG: FAD binding domain-containing protein [Xanthobacteraceae bacterium]
MKAASFEYVRPRSVEEVCVRLSDDPEAVIIAGGQTLVPMMAMRLARPTCLVDVARIPELHGIRDAGAAIVIGAATRQATAASDALVMRMRCGPTPQQPGRVTARHHPDAATSFAHAAATQYSRRSGTTTALTGPAAPHEIQPFRSGGS